MVPTPKAAASGTKTPAGSVKPGRTDHEQRKRRKRDEERLRRRVENAEAEISRLEALRESLAMAMADPAHSTDVEKLQELQSELDQAAGDLQEAISEWERLSLRLDAFLDGATP